MKKLFLLLIIPFNFLFAAGKPVLWPIQGLKVIPSSETGWKNQYYAYKEKDVFSITPNLNNAEILPVVRLGIVPDHVKVFFFTDVNAVVGWNNEKKRLEIVVLTKANKPVFQDVLKLKDTVNDLDLRFGQGRRPAFLLYKESSGEYKLSILFDEREQVIFLQDNPILAFNLLWNQLSAYSVTRSGTKPVIKVWEKGMVTTIELPFIPLSSNFVQTSSGLFLFAVDARATLWKFQVTSKTIQGGIVDKNPDFAFIEKIYTVNVNNEIDVALVISSQKKLIIEPFDNQLKNTTGKSQTFSLMDDNIILPGSVAESIMWLETNITDATYIFTKDIEFRPITELNWRVNLTQGYPEVFFSWKSFPQKKNYSYRYIIDKNPLSPPLPEYRLNEPVLKVTLSEEGNYYLHIQAMDPESKWESPVYHIPVFWKYKPSIPEIYLKNEITPYVVSGDNVSFVISNLKPLIYYTEVNTIPVYDPLRQINPASGEVVIKENLKPGRYYIHIRSRDPRTNEFSPTLHYLFFYQTYTTEYTVGTSEYNKDIGRLNSLINRYKNSQSNSEKEEILRELDELKKEIEADIGR